MSLLLALTILIGILPLQALAEDPPAPDDPGSPAGDAPEQGADSGDDEKRSVYYEVRFELPDELKDITPEEREEIRMPETMMVPAGTPVASLALPERV